MAQLSPVTLSEEAHQQKSTARGTALDFTSVISHSQACGNYSHRTGSWTGALLARDGPLQIEVPATTLRPPLYKLLQALILIINGDCVSFFKDSLGIMTTL